jgi:hypothetical protein
MKNNKILVSAALLLLIAALSLNFEGSNFTGSIIKNSVTKIYVEPYTIEAGQVMDITVKPGKEGVNQEMIIKRAKNDLRVAGESPRICKAYKCKEETSFEYRIRDDYDEGVYYFEAYDRASESYVRTYFKVKAKYSTESPKQHW